MEKATLIGKFHIALFDENKLIEERDVFNTVMNAGKAEMSGLLLTDVGGQAFDYVSVGTGTTLQMLHRQH